MAFSVKEASAARQTLSPCRKEGPGLLGEEGRGASDSLQLAAVWPRLSLCPGCQGVTACGQQAKL